MCTYSMIVDYYTEKWQQQSPGWPTTIEPGWPFGVKVPTQAEIDEFRELLDRAREYDRRNNQPDCELESKKQKIRQLAEELGIADKINFL